MAHGQIPRLREATPHDVPDILLLIRELAAFENLSHSITTDAARLEADGFGPSPRFKILLAEDEEGILGYLSYMTRYSIWAGGEFLTLDDLYLRERARGKGLGLALMQRLAAIAAEQGMPVRWELLIDNLPARTFYTMLGAKISEKLIANWSVESLRAVVEERA